MPPWQFQSFHETDISQIFNFKSFYPLKYSSVKAVFVRLGHLNWWSKECDCQKLWPLSTSGDGNCLLHAASLGMWGFHDRLLILRKAVHLMLTKGVRRHALWRRWRWQQSRENKEVCNGGGSILCFEMVYSSKDAVASEGTEVIYESLEGLHVFALAHVLRRPIVIASDTVLKNSGGEALSPIHFGGIYLPLECSSAECHRYICDCLPIVLHTIIPITTRDRELLPLHFAADPGPDFTWWEDEEDAKIAMFTDLGDVKKLELISQYMDLVKIPVIKGERFTNVNSGGNEAAKLLQDDAQRRWNTIPLVKSVGNLYSGGSQTFSRITKSVKQKFMSGYRSKKADTDLPKFQRVDSTMLSQFMEEMIDNYLKAARTRFEGRKEGGMETTKRERLSRGFNSGVSAEVLLLKSPDNGNSVPLYERPSSPLQTNTMICFPPFLIKHLFDTLFQRLKLCNLVSLSSVTYKGRSTSGLMSEVYE
ncbi:unnamed protein product [Soboliphyme baturini]|uniref:ubiquitinyl hydrolase 1 n=1 Tax=Soboliphyme baturini TaxID=241478 RepID=A0A183IKG9_9BILA|nr:unnamed protein product [Soboliphyme baturini]